MWTPYSFNVNHEQHADLRWQAEAYRLGNPPHFQSTTAAPYAVLFAWFGRKLVNSGRALEKRYGAQNVQLDQRPAL